MKNLKRIETNKVNDTTCEDLDLLATAYLLQKQIATHYLSCVFPISGKWFLNEGVRMS